MRREPGKRRQPIKGVLWSTAGGASEQGWSMHLKVQPGGHRWARHGHTAKVLTREQPGLRSGLCARVIQALCGARERSLHVMSTQEVSWAVVVDGSVSMSASLSPPHLILHPKSQGESLS